MTDDIELPPRGYSTGDVSEQPARVHRRRRRWPVILALVILVPILLVVLYTWSAVHFTYSHGERSGYVQKFSRKGWLCKTWEGELAMANLPGTMPAIFHFTVHDPAVAAQIDRDMGKRVSLSYEQHKGVPTSCFGDTEYYVVRAQAR